jgi:isopenicillin N synthase-like dioxygenase
LILLRGRSHRWDVAKQVDDACRTVGFFITQNHGLSAAVVDKTWEASRDFFDLPLEEKLRMKTKDDAVYPYGTKTASD